MPVVSNEPPPAKQTAHIGETHPEWPVAWASLADLTGDYADCNPDNGECWQYMGSVRYFGIWAHEFRHRCRPNTANRRRHSGTGRCYLSLPASAGFAG